MSTIKDRLQEDIKTAMREKDDSKRSALRFIMAALKQKEVDERVELTDADVLKILDKMTKQRRDAITQFTAANRQDLADKEQYELDILQQYLPKALSHTEVDQAIHEAILSTHANGVKDMGKVMGVLKPQLQGRADLGQVSQRVKELLAS